MVLVGSAAFAVDGLFPQPLHLTRRIEDPVSRSTATIHEYCAGNRVVTVNGNRVAIADYAKQELTEIDRTAGTYSVTSFADLAKTAPAVAHRTLTASADATRVNARPHWKSAALGVKPSASGRSMDVYEATLDRSDDEHVKLEIGVDRNVRLSRAAVEVLIGASFPNSHSDEHDAILEAASGKPAAHPLTSNSTMANAAEYGLPVEQVTTFTVAGEQLTVRNAIVDIRNDLPPNDVLTIPSGATRVESRAVRLARELRELDRLPPASQPQ
jgi:hypothetical protein